MRVSTGTGPPIPLHGDARVKSHVPTSVRARVPSKEISSCAIPEASDAAVCTVRTPRCHAEVLIVPPASATDGGVGSLTKTRTLLMEAWFGSAVFVEHETAMHSVSRSTRVAPRSGRSTEPVLQEAAASFQMACTGTQIPDT